MKLSDAIMLGSTKTRLSPSVWLGGNEGCLIGIGLSAFGLTSIGGTWVPKEITDRFPWLLEDRPIPDIARTKLPPEEFSIVNHFYTVENKHSAPAWFIISRMAYLVYHNAITFESAVDWIRSVEPTEALEPETPSAADAATPAHDHQEVV